jgi:D-amino-acid dehydrogenase
MGSNREITVVGAGIIGLCCALYLQRDGNKVTVLDALGPGEGCSKGNAGVICSDACAPMSRPGVLFRIAPWLMDPLSPIAISWRYLPLLAPWLARFVVAGTRYRVEAQSKALRELLIRAHEAYTPLLEIACAQHMVRATGYVSVYETERAWRNARSGREIRARRGVPQHELDAATLSQLEPDLSTAFRRGIFFPESSYCVNPHGLVNAFAESFTRAGGSLLRTRVEHCALNGNSPRIQTSDGESRPELLIIAGGHESNHLAQMLGSRVPLEVQRGYHATLPSSGVTVSRPVLFAERMFIATPMQMGLRLAGTVEFAGPTAAPAWQRAKSLVTEAQRYIPRLAVDNAAYWMGLRPCLPDSLPVISVSPYSSAVIYAFGHGHIGLTCAAVTGRIVADLAAERKCSIDLAPFRVDRF